MLRRGFTIVELIITITIMGILMVLAVVALSNSQLQSRDDKRAADTSTIATNLESFYTSGINPSASMPVITNLVANPSFEADVSNWFAASGTISRATSTSYSGVGSLKFDSTAAAQLFYLSAFIPTTAGKTYTASIMIKGTGTATLALSTQPTAGQIANSGSVTLTSSWQQITVSGTTPSGATSVYPVIFQQSAGAQTFYVDAVMITQGTTNYSYADGSFGGGWAWTAGANSSTSSGPAVLPNSAATGTYPPLAITSSPLLTTYLPDADTKAFTAPGQTDPYATFDPATNTVQTAAGVLPQPTVNQYIYQPIDSAGALCYNYSCRKFNLYYRTEADNVVHMITSKNQ